MNIKKIVSYLLCMALIASSAAVAFALGVDSFSDDFQSGNLSKWKIAASKNNVGVVSDPLSSSNKVVRFNLPKNGATSARLIKDKVAPYGSTVRYSWKFMVDPSHNNNAAYEKLTMFPAYSGADAPTVGVFYQSGSMKVYIYDSSTKKHIFSKSVSLTKGKWAKLDLEIKWSKDGYVKAWVDGSDITAGGITGPTTPNTSGNFLELGVYRPSGSTGTSRVFYDNVTIKEVASSTSGTTSGSTTDTATGSTSGTTTGTTTGSTSGSTTGTTSGSTTDTATGSTSGTTTGTTTGSTSGSTIVSGGTPEVFYETFSAGNFSQWDALENYNGQVGQIVADPTNPNNKVFKAYTWAGNDKNIRPRAELRVDNGEDMNKEYWYSWKFMIDPSTNHNSASEIIGQWHTQPDPAKGETWSNWTDGSFAMALEIRPDGQLDFASTPMGITMLRSGIYPEKGKWHTITWHIKQSTGSDGFVEAWVDGKSLIPQGRIYGKTAYNEAGGYLKIGSYRYNYTSWSNPTTYATGTSTVYYDDVKISANKANVDVVQ